MLDIITGVLIAFVFFKLLFVGIKAAWGLTKILLTIVLLPLILVGMLIAGFTAVSLIGVVILGLISLIL